MSNLRCKIFTSKKLFMFTYKRVRKLFHPFATLFPSNILRYKTNSSTFFDVNTVNILIVYRYNNYRIYGEFLKYIK